MFGNALLSLSQNTNEEVKKLAQFLGASTDETFISDVVKMTSFDSMKVSKGKNETFKGKDQTEAPIMYRKGKFMSFHSVNAYE